MDECCASILGDGDVRNAAVVPHQRHHQRNQSFEGKCAPKLRVGNRERFNEPSCVEILLRLSSTNYCRDSEIAPFVSENAVGAAIDGEVSSSQLYVRS